MTVTCRKFRRFTLFPRGISGAHIVDHVLILLTILFILQLQEVSFVLIHHRNWKDIFCFKVLALYTWKCSSK